MTGAVGRCSPCAVNSYRDEVAAPREACSRCPPYSYTRSLASDSIAGCICLAGARRNSSASKADLYANLCVSCPAGFSADLNSAEGVCTACLPGTYRPSTAEPSEPCINCPVNTKSLKNASTSLEECLSVPGYFRNGSMATALPCPAGFYTNEHGMTECLKCTSTSVAQAGSARCEACPENSFAHSATQCACKYVPDLCPVPRSSHSFSWLVRSPLGAAQGVNSTF